MPAIFFSTKQYFPGFAGNPVAFHDGKVYSPYSMGVHRGGGSIRYENIWCACRGDALQLEFPWGRNYTAIEEGQSLLEGR